MKDLLIILGKSVSGVSLGDSEQQVLAKLGEPKARTKTEVGWYILDYETLKVWVEPDKVEQIGSYKGYVGKTEDGIGIGTPRDELKRKSGLDIAYHKDDDYWEFISKPGTLFEFGKDEKGGEIINTIYIAT